MIIVERTDNYPRSIWPIKFGYAEEAKLTHHIPLSTPSTTRKYSTEELSLLYDTSLSDVEVASRMGRSANAVHEQRRKRNVT